MVLLAENRGVNNEKSTVNYTKEEMMPCNHTEFLGLGFSWNITLAISTASRMPCTQISLRTPFPSRYPVPNLKCIKEAGKMLSMGTEGLNMSKEVMPGYELRLRTLNGSGWSNLSRSQKEERTVDSTADDIR